MQQIPEITCKMPENLYFIAKAAAIIRTVIATRFTIITEYGTLPAMFSEKVSILVKVP